MQVMCERCFDRLLIVEPAVDISHHVALCSDCIDELDGEVTECPAGSSKDDGAGAGP